MPREDDMRLEMLEEENERLRKALEPFANMAATGFKGSVYETLDEGQAVLFHHATGTQITLGDFIEAQAVLA